MNFKNVFLLKSIIISSGFVKSIMVHSLVSEIGNDAFYECSYLENIIFEEESNLTIIGNNIFHRECHHQLKEISSHSFKGVIN